MRRRSHRDDRIAALHGLLANCTATLGRRHPRGDWVASMKVSGAAAGSFSQACATIRASDGRSSPSIAFAKRRSRSKENSYFWRDHS